MGSAEERIQPQNLEAEQCLIGSLLLDSAAMQLGVGQTEVLPPRATR